MTKVLQLLDAGQDISQLLKNVTVLDAVYWIAAAVKDINADTVTRCFVRCGFFDASASHGSDDLDEFDNDDRICLADLLRRWKTVVNSTDDETVETYVTFDDDVETCGTPCLGDAWIQTNEDVEDEDYDEPPAKPVPTRRQIVSSFESIEDYCRYAEMNDELHLVVKLKDSVTRHMDAKAKQTDIRNFFSQ